MYIDSYCVPQLTFDMSRRGYPSRFHIRDILQRAARVTFEAMAGVLRSSAGARRVPSSGLWIAVFVVRVVGSYATRPNKGTRWHAALKA
jgi:hypothetical protein